MMDDITLINLVKHLAKDAISYRDQLSKDRSDATDYYNGEMPDLPSEKGRSQMVSKDVRAAIKKVMPSIKRTLLNGTKIFEYKPFGPGDEESSKQATDFINHVIFPESDGRDALYDAFHDAALLRTGIVQVWYDKKASVEISQHTGLDEAALTQLVAGDNVEVLEQDESLEVIETEQGPIETPVYNVKIRRREESGKPTVEAVPLEEFLILSDAKTVEDARFVGRVKRLTRGDLVAMGYDKETVYNLPIATELEDELENSRDDRVDADYGTNRTGDTPNDPSIQEIDYYEIYVRADRDGDGLSELIRITFGGIIGQNTLLDVEDWDRQPFVDFVCERQPHQLQGAAIADDVMDIQKVKTSLLRSTLDNIYWQNRAQPVIVDGAIEDEDAVFAPEFGKPIRINAGRNIKDVLDYNRVPFVAESSFGMLSYFDEMVQDRTGISDASSGLAPDALQNMTAKASAMIENAGIGQTELIVKCLASGVAKVGELLLHLTIQHQDKPRTVRLRDEWVEYDPRHWNAAMDVTVNTGLGAGTRERDMQMMQIVLGIHEKIIAAFGNDNPFVKPDNLYNTLSEMLEAAGLVDVDKFLTKPDEQEIAARMQAEAQKPDPEQAKLQAQLQIEAAKMQASQAKEQAQMQADLQVKAAEQENDRVAQTTQLEADATRAELDAAIQREKLNQDYELETRRLEQDREIALAKINADALKIEANEMTAFLDEFEHDGDPL